MNEKQWNAICSNDSNYDGEFYYALSSTQTVCRPSCTSRTPNPKNVFIFNDVNEAVKKGFRPCQRCKPNELEWEGYKKDLVEKVKDYIQRHFNENITLNDISHALQKNSYYIQRTFKEYLGVSPLNYLHEIRIKKAKSLLFENKLSITDISFEVGYSSSAHFSIKFKQTTGISPRVFRKSLLNKKALNEDSK